MPSGTGATYDHHIGGAELITFGFNSAASTPVDRTLGYTLNGVNIAIQMFERPIFGDQNGGQDGPPVDMILHPSLVEVSFTLIDFKKAELENLVNYFISGVDTDDKAFGTEGYVPPAAGTLLLGGTTGAPVSVQLICESTASTWGDLRFYHAQLTNPFSFNLSTNETQIPMTYRCFKGDEGKIFDRATTPTDLEA